MRKRNPPPAPPESARIELDDRNDVRRWTRELKVSEDTLRGAIAAVGSNSATRVREYLKTSGLA